MPETLDWLYEHGLTLLEHGDTTACRVDADTIQFMMCPDADETAATYTATMCLIDGVPHIDDEDGNWNEIEDSDAAARAVALIREPLIL